MFNYFTFENKIFNIKKNVNYFFFKKYKIITFDDKIYNEHFELKLNKYQKMFSTIIFKNYFEDLSKGSCLFDTINTMKKYDILIKNKNKITFHQIKKIIKNINVQDIHKNNQNQLNYSINIDFNVFLIFIFNLILIIYNYFIFEISYFIIIIQFIFVYNIYLTTVFNNYHIKLYTNYKLKIINVNNLNYNEKKIYSVILFSKKRMENNHMIGMITCNNKIYVFDSNIGFIICKDFNKIIEDLINFYYTKYNILFDKNNIKIKELLFY